MKSRMFVAVFILTVLIAGYVSHVSSTPSLNGTAPGCGPAGGCHTFAAGILSVTSIGNLQVRLTLIGATGNVAGELVDSTGTVVAVNNGTSSNPFVLTAPHAGRYTVNGGLKSPSPRRWDSTQVLISLTGIHDQGSEVLPTEYRLEQNYPNPFNPTTTIKYALPVGTRHAVSLHVFDALGREVATLVNEVQQPGTRTIQFDGSHLASGVFLYRLQAGDFVTVKKMLLVR